MCLVLDMLMYGDNNMSMPTPKIYPKHPDFDDFVVSELHMGSGSLTGLPNQSAPRIQMGWQEFYNSDPMVKATSSGRGAETPYVSTGHELLRALSTVRVQLPLKDTTWIVQDKYSVGVNRFVIFKSTEGVIHIANYQKTTNYGRRKAVNLYPPKGKPDFNKIKPGMRFKGGDILLAPKTGLDGWYKQGRNLNVLAISDRRVPDDGFVISETLAKETATITTKVYTLNMNSNDVLMGNPELEKYIPDVGDIIPPSGLIVGKRELGSDIFNVPAYVEYKRDPFAIRSTDIFKISQLPVEGHVTKVEIIGVNPRLNFNDNMGYQNLTMHLNDLLTEWKEFSYSSYLKEPNLTQDAALIALKAFVLGSKRFKLEDTKDLVPEVTIKIDVQYTIPLHKGSKMASTVGGKGIVVNVLPDHQMPVDSNGVRAHLLKGANVTVKRNIPTDDILPLEGAIMRTGHMKMLGLLGLDLYASRDLIKEHLEKADQSTMNALSDMYLRLIRLFNKEQADKSIKPMKKNPIGWFTDILYDKLSVVRNLTQSLKLDIREILNDPNVKEFTPAYENIQIWSERLNKYIPSPKKTFIGNMYMFTQHFDSYDPSATNSSRYYPDRTIAPKTTEELRDTTPVRDSVLVVQGQDELTQFPQAAKLSTLAKYRYSTSNIDGFRNQVLEYLTKGVCSEIDLESISDISTDGLIVLNHLLNITGHKLTPNDELGDDPKLISEWEIDISDIGSDMR